METGEAQLTEGLSRPGIGGEAGSGSRTAIGGAGVDQPLGTFSACVQSVSWWQMTE